MSRPRQHLPAHPLETMNEQNPWVVEVNALNFEQEIILRSSSVPVLAYFWADWAEPCAELGAALEQYANLDPGRFVLAKINADQSPDLVQGFRVRGVPAVLAIVGGKMADGFEGALAGPELEAFLDRVAKPRTTPAQELMAQVTSLVEAGEHAAALAELEGFLATTPDEQVPRLLLIDLLIDAGETERAEAHYAELSDAAQASPEGSALRERLDFIATAPPLDELRSAVETQPEDAAARLEFGRALLATKAFAEGFEELLEALRLDDGETGKQAKASMLAAFEALGLEDEIANEYRFKLSLELFA